VQRTLNLELGGAAHRHPAAPGGSAVIGTLPA
jgi:hypothetical protein